MAESGLFKNVYEVLSFQTSARDNLLKLKSWREIFFSDKKHL